MKLKKNDIFKPKTPLKKGSGFKTFKVKARQMGRGAKI
jgi:hypothetical protein